MSLRAVIRWRLVFAGLTTGLVVAIATAATVSLRGSWFVPGAEIGVASGSYETACLFPYVLFTLPPEETVKEIPVSQFTATGPQTITFSGTKHFKRVDIGAYVTTLDYDWTMSITYQCVD